MSESAAIERLLEIMAKLRDPDGGCPWDLEQDFTTIAPYTIEEAYEVDDAIRREDWDGLRDELGDLLLQVVFHAQIAREAGRFDFADVVRAISDKLVRRHPHVFGDVAVSGAEEVVGNWARIKREQEGRDDPLAGIPAALPALQLAAKLQKRAAEEGFAWPDHGGPVAKLREELDELLAVVDEGDGGAEPGAAGGRADWELGDLLFAAVALALASGVEPEGALRRAARRFRSRFTRARDLALAEGLDPAGLQLDDWLGYWARAKRLA